jgi:hypothetical protein
MEPPTLTPDDELTPRPKARRVVVVVALVAAVALPSLAWARSDTGSRVAQRGADRASDGAPTAANPMDVSEAAPFDPGSPPTEPAPLRCAEFDSLTAAQIWHDDNHGRFDMSMLDSDGDGAVCTAAFPPTVPEQAPVVPPDSRWDVLAHCESKGNWSIRTGNGFYGGLQFVHTSWVEFGGLGFAERADLATRDEQIFIAERVLARQGWVAWPGCTRLLGWR